MATILITGASGLIGSALTEQLLGAGHQVVYLARSSKPSRLKTFSWDIAKGYIEPGALDNVDAIVHLAGAGIADKRWTSERKREILASRTQSTQLLFKELLKGNHKVAAFIGASAIGYYGTDCGNSPVPETAAPGSDFLAHVTQRWESEVEKIESLGIRVVKIRTGIVLSDKGGALPKLAQPVKLFAGAPLGSGNQWMSWIHIHDHCGIIMRAITDSRMTGPYNSVAPVPVTNRELTREVARQLRRPLIIPSVPSFVLKIILGEMAVTVTTGCNISSTKVEAAGYQFRYPALPAALKNLLG